MHDMCTNTHKSTHTTQHNLTHINRNLTAQFINSFLGISHVIWNSTCLAHFPLPPLHAKYGLDQNRCCVANMLILVVVQLMILQFLCAESLHLVTKNSQNWEYSQAWHNATQNNIKSSYLVHLRHSWSPQRRVSLSQQRRTSQTLGAAQLVVYQWELLCMCGWLDDLRTADIHAYAWCFSSRISSWISIKNLILKYPG